MAYIKLEDLQKFPIRLNNYDKENGNEDFVLGIEFVIEYAENLPKTEPTIATGRWVDRYNNKFGNHLYVCSECGEEAGRESGENALGQEITRQKLTPFCPNCGVRMAGGNAE